jgi:hypothetical protein
LEFLTTDLKLEDIDMNNFQKDILIGLIFITGILGFISGEFIISTILFASAAVASNVLHYEK